MCKSIKDEPKLIIPSDKTSNFYKLPINMYKKLRNQDVQKNFKKQKKEALEKVTADHQKIAHSQILPLHVHSFGNEQIQHKHFLLPDMRRK